MLSLVESIGGVGVVINPMDSNVSIASCVELLPVVVFKFAISSKVSMLDCCALMIVGVCKRRVSKTAAAVLPDEINRLDIDDLIMLDCLYEGATICNA